MDGTSEPKRRRAVYMLLISACLWSLGGLLIKKISWNPVAIAGTRSALAALFLLPFARRAHITWSPPQVGGAIAYAGTVIFFVVANKLTTAANTILLQYTAPVYVALFGAWFLGERPRWFDWVTIAVVLGGTALFFLDRLTIAGSWGNVCAITAGVAMAWMTLFMRKQKTSSPMESVFLGNVLTALVCSPFVFVSMPPDASNWVPLLILGIVQLGLPYLLFSWAIKHVTAIEGILTTTIEPILNPVWVFLAIGERPGPWAFVGGVIVLVTVTIRSGLAAARKEAG